MPLTISPAKPRKNVFSMSCIVPIIFLGLSVCLYLHTIHHDIILDAISKGESLPKQVFVQPSGNLTHGLTLNTALSISNSSASRLLVSSLESKDQQRISTTGLGAHPTSCKVPVHKIVYIKTHKTGSTTLVSILQRYGYERNMSFALAKGGHIICDKQLFKASMIYQIPFRKQHDFDMLVNHARYNRREMDKVVPHAKYISIIRNPVTQLESVFGYFEVGRHLNIPGSNPFRTFISNPKMYYERKASSSKIRNGQLFDLGFDHKFDENTTKIQKKIAQLSKEIDFMLINEYFDESLIILRKLFCWEFEDILYLSHGIRSKTHRFKVSEDLAADVLEWSAGDAMLYSHFNKTFWAKVKDYGTDFKKDLEYFHSLEKKAFNACVNTGEKNRKDRRVEKYVLKTDTSKFCKDMLRDDVVYTKLIRTGMVKRAALEGRRSVRSNHYHRKIRPEKASLAIPSRKITNRTRLLHLTNRSKGRG